MSNPWVRYVAVMRPHQFAEEFQATARFRIRDGVCCRVDSVGDGTGDVAWVAGTIAGIGARDARNMLPGRCTAYKVLLDQKNPYDGLEELQKMSGSGWIRSGSQE